MKKSWKRSLSLLVAVVMVLAMLPANVLATETPTVITNEAGLIAAFENGGVYELGASFTVSTKIATTSASKDVDLDLKGHTINVTSSLIDLLETDLTLRDSSENGTGKIVGPGSTVTNAITIKQNATFTMYGGTITNFKGNYGAVRVDGPGNAVFNMHGGSITGNYGSASYPSSGVGVKRGTFNMYGGSITGNNAGDLGVVADGTTYSSDVVITGASVVGSITTKLNANNKTPSITIKELTSGASIGPVDKQLSATNANITTSIDDTVREAGSGSAWTYTWKEVVVAQDPAAQIGESTYETLEAALEAATGSDVIVLKKTVELGTAVAIAKNITIDLAGYSIKSTNSAGRMFDIANSKLTIQDSVGTGKLEGNPDVTAGGSTYGIHLGANGELELQNGTITGFKGTTVGAIRLDQPTSKFIMSGGEISGNSATNSGYGVIFNNRGTVQISGGRIENTTSAGADLYMQSDSNYAAKAEISGDAFVGDVRIKGTAAKPATVSIQDLEEGASFGPVTITTADGTVTVSTDNTVVENSGVYSCKPHEHVDEDKDHFCDTCQERIECSDVTTDNDHNCDICGAKLGEHTYGENGYCACGEPNPAAVALVDGTLYLSLEDAIAEALKGTATVKVVKDTTLNKTVFVDRGKHLTIDLNGCKVTIAENAAANNLTSPTSNSIFYLRTSADGNVAKLTIQDTVGGGMFDAEDAEGIVSFVRLSNDSKFYLEGGTIANVTGSNAGAVVNVEGSGAMFEMSGGKITGNTSTHDTGRIVYVANGTFNMTGGEISGNTPATGRSDVERGNGTISISGSAKLETLGSAATLGALTKGARIVSKVNLTLGEDAEGTFSKAVVDGKYVYTYIVSNTKQNVRLQDLIKVGFYFTAPENATSVGALVWTKEAYEAETNRTATNEDANYPVGQTADGYVVETAGVKAQNLDQVYVMIPYAVIGGEYVYGDAQEYSALDYAKKAYESTDPELADARTLIIDLLNYGTAARNYFYTRDGKTDSAAPFNSILSDADKVVNWNESMRETYGVGTTDGTLNIDRYGRSASLLEAIQLNVFYTGDSFSAAKFWLDAADKHDATVSAATVSGQAMTKVSIPNIYSFNIYDDYSLQPVEGDAVGNTTVTSVAAYLTKVVDSNNDAACVALAKAMMVYGFHADAIFNQ